MYDGISFEYPDLAWTGLSEKEVRDVINTSLSTNNNILTNRNKFEVENPGAREIYIMNHCTEYIYFAVKTLLSKDITPMQMCMLHMLWKHPFPMLIGSRGLSKAISPDELVRVKGGWTKIKDLSVGDQVYGSNGKLCNVMDKTELQKDLDFYRITLKDGRTIEACADHQWKIWDKNKNRKKRGQQRDTNWTVVKTRDMVERFYYDRKDSKSKDPEARTREYIYAIPTNESLANEEEKALPIHPYVLGVLIGDGSITTKSISFTTADPEIAQLVGELLPQNYEVSPSTFCSMRYGIKIRSDAPKNTPAFYTLLSPLGIFGKKSEFKFIPEAYKFCSADQKLQLLRGLMDTDGSATSSGSISFSSASEVLANDVADLSRSIGIQCKLARYKAFIKDVRYLDQFTLHMYTDREVFAVPRKLARLNKNKSKAGQSKYEKIFITNIEPIGKKDGICIQVDSPDNTYITKDYIVTHNSFSLAMYCLLRCALMQGTKIVCVGSAFRQSKLLHGYVEEMWNSAPVLRSIFKADTDGTRISTDMITFTLGKSKISFIPLGTGDKIRGLRANIIVADEMNSLDTNVYEIVVNNFAAVSMNPVQNMQNKAKIRALQNRGLDVPEGLLQAGFQNQSIVAGTMGFADEPMYSYWKRYKDIIESKGEILKTENSESIDLSYKDFCIMRLPYELIPKGFMDDKTIARAKATIHIGAYNSEYGCVPIKDTAGFFRRSIIEACVANEKHVGKEDWPEWCPNVFDARISGEDNIKYTMGVDPASEEDNFAITIVEVRPEHQRVVYCWTTNREEVKQSDPNANYYAYCASKIRDLCARFNIVKVGIDAQGGGIPLSEALHDKNGLKEGEVPFWPEVIIGNLQDTDRMAGNHILRMVQFANYAWLSNANHSLLKDLEGKTLLFPRYDALVLGLAGDRQFGALDLEECLVNIEELKSELSTIVLTRTANRERWDTPQIKTDTNKIGRMRKDRYSSLLIANDLAREVNRNFVPDNDRKIYGGRVGDVNKLGGNFYLPGSPLAEQIGAPSYRAILRT